MVERQLASPLSGRSPLTLGLAACVILLSGFVIATAIASAAIPANVPTAIVDVNLTPLWQLGGEDQLLGTITDVFRDSNGDICLLDTQRHALVVYSPEGEYIRSMGREGEGPGEFRRPRGAFAVPDGYAVIQSLPVRLITFDWQGIPEQSILPVLHGRQPGISVANCSDGCAWGDNILLASIFFWQDAGGDHIQEELALYDRDGRKLAVLLYNTHPADLTVISELEDNYYVHRFIADNRSLFVAPDFEKYEVRVLGPGGSPSGVINRQCPLLKRTPEELRRVGYSLGQERSHMKNMRFEIMDHHRAIEQLDLGPDNQLWVLTGEGAWRSPAGVLGTFDVYSAESLSLLHRVRLHSMDSLLTDLAWIIGDQVIVVKCARERILGTRDAGAPCSDAVEAQVICYTMEDH